MATTGVVGADGHITHFSRPAQHPHPHPQPIGQRSVASILLRRVARCSVVGLSCAAGYVVLCTPWREVLSRHEVATIRKDLRLEQMCEDMDRTLNDTMPEFVRRHGGS